MKPTIDQIVAMLKPIRDKCPLDESVWVYLEPAAGEPGFCIATSPDDLGIEVYGDDDDKMLIVVACMILEYAEEEDDGR